LARKGYNDAPKDAITIFMFVSLTIALPGLFRWWLHVGTSREDSIGTAEVDESIKRLVLNACSLFTKLCGRFWSHRHGIKGCAHSRQRSHAISQTVASCGIFTRILGSRLQGVRGKGNGEGCFSSPHGGIAKAVKLWEREWMPFYDLISVSSPPSRQGFETVRLYSP
jgi:hypothetical protein